MSTVLTDPTVGGSAGAPAIFSAAGPAAAAIAEVSWVLIIGAVVLFAGTMALLFWALRREAGEVRVVWWLVGGGLLLPLVVLTALFVYSTQRAPSWKAIPPKDALIVSVTGRMWWWEIRYRDPVTGTDIVSANELRMPVGRPVYLALSSAEVIHSLWIPQLGGKMDLVPGRINHPLLTASVPGVYRGQCAEFCGEAHAHMALHAVAMPPSDFDTWLTAQAKPAASVISTPVGAADSAADATTLKHGRQVFETQRCAACHTVRGVADGARLGPDLTHVGSRLYLAAGTLPNHATGMAQWLAEVHTLKPGTRMPSYARLEAADREALARWLTSLQ